MKLNSGGRIGLEGVADPEGNHAKIARAHAEPLHLLLTDVVMPLMSGLQLAAEVRALRPEVKILLMSAYRTKESRNIGLGWPLGDSFWTSPSRFPRSRG